MQHFIGSKRVKAAPMTRGEYNTYRGWELPADENGDDEGFLVEYIGGDSNHPKHQGYISWSPKTQFEEAYQTIRAMGFGHAIRCAKEGHRVARQGWNGQGMFVVYMKAEEQENTQPYFQMKTADGSWQPGWLASQSDMIAEDWYIVDADL